VTGRLVDAAAIEDDAAAGVCRAAATGAGAGGWAATGTALWHDAVNNNPAKVDKTKSLFSI